jgi:predicted kinase
MSPEPTIHLMCGLVAAGKTTLARQLARDLPAVRLSRDEWMLRLYGGRYDDPTYIARLQPCTEVLWDVATGIVGAGSSVILDWNFWNRELRSQARHRADACGAALVVHWLDVPVDLAAQRAKARLNDHPPDAHDIDEGAVRQFATIFEPPTTDESVAIDHHR